MAKFRIDGVKFNPKNWAGLDAGERKACGAFMAARARELNTIATAAHECHGGPFAGHTMEMDQDSPQTAQINVGAWAGRYIVNTGKHRLEWDGNNGGQAIPVHAHARSEGKQGEVTAGGFTQLQDLFSELAEDPKARDNNTNTSALGPIQPRATYTIGRTAYTIAATPEAADRLRARVSRAKKWFADKWVSAPKPAALTAEVAAEAEAYTAAPETVAAPKTCEEVAAFIMEKIAARAIGEEEKYQAEQVQKGRATQADAAERIEKCRTSWGRLDSQSHAYARASKLAQAIISKDPRPLVAAWEQSITLHKGSVSAFGELTGIKLARMNSAERTAAIFEWAGWTAEQFAAYKTDQAAIADAAEAARAAKEAEQNDKRTESLAASSRLRISGTKDVTTVQAYIDELISQGFTSFEKRKSGSATRSCLMNPSTCSYYVLKAGILADYARIAAARLTAPAADQAETPDQADPGISPIFAAMAQAKKDQAEAAEQTQAPAPAAQPAALAASLAIGQAQASAAEHQAEADEPAELAEAVADGPATEAEAVADYTGPLKTQAHAANYTQPLKTPVAALRADFKAARTQKIESKSGAWHAFTFRTSAGRPALSFNTPDGREYFSEYETGAERMRDLQAMARDTEDEAREASDNTTQPETPAALAGFERARPVRVDLKVLIAGGMQPAELVGLGVNYSGDMANPSGTGAIVAAEPCKWYGLKLSVLLEDGRRRECNGHSFADTPGSRYALNWKNHGAPYLADLAAAEAARKAQASSAKEVQQQAHAQDLEKLAAEFPHLERAAGSKYHGGTMAARNIRRMLKDAFKAKHPSVKFSVTSDYSACNVSWTDGPTSDQVNAVIGRFDIGRSDSQSDYFYTVESAWSKLFGGVQYLFTRREESDAMISAAIAAAFEGYAEAPTVNDWRKATGILSNHCDHDYNRRRVTQRLAAMEGPAKA